MGMGFRRAGQLHFESFRALIFPMALFAIQPHHWAHGVSEAGVRPCEQLVKAYH